MTEDTKSSFQQETSNQIPASIGESPTNQLENFPFEVSPPPLPTVIQSSASPDREQTIPEMPQLTTTTELQTTEIISTSVSSSEAGQIIPETSKFTTLTKLQPAENISTSAVSNKEQAVPQITQVVIPTKPQRTEIISTTTVPDEGQIVLEIPQITIITEPPIAKMISTSSLAVGQIVPEIPQFITPTEPQPTENISATTSSDTGQAVPEITHFFTPTDPQLTGVTSSSDQSQIAQLIYYNPCVSYTDRVQLLQTPQLNSSVTANKLLNVWSTALSPASPAYILTTNSTNSNNATNQAVNIPMSAVNMNGAICTNQPINMQPVQIITQEQLPQQNQLQQVSLIPASNFFNTFHNNSNSYLTNNTLSNVTMINTDRVRPVQIISAPHQSAQINVTNSNQPINLCSSSQKISVVGDSKTRNIKQESKTQVADSETLPNKKHSDDGEHNGGAACICPKCGKRFKDKRVRVSYVSFKAKKVEVEHVLCVCPDCREDDQ